MSTTSPTRDRTLRGAGSRSAAVPDAATCPTRSERIEERIAYSRRTATPLAVSGERGTGRTTVLRVLMRDADPAQFDGLDLLYRDERDWLQTVVTALDSGNRPVVVDNVHLLSPLAAHGLYAATTHTERWFALASAPPESLSPDVFRLIDSCRTRIELIPLRLRKQEITSLIDHMLIELNSSIRFTPAAIRMLKAHNWPGNLAELRAEVVTAARTRSVGDVSERDLGRLRERLATAPLNAIDSAQRTVIEDELIARQGNKLVAAQRLGMSRTTLYKRMQQFGIAG